jgi:hypothetical protein
MRPATPMGSSPPPHREPPIHLPPEWEAHTGSHKSGPMPPESTKEIPVKKSLFAPGGFLGFPMRNLRIPSPSFPSFNSFFNPGWGNKKIPTETSFDDYPGEKAYHAPKISGVNLSPDLGHIQRISRHPRKVGDIFYRILIFSSWFIGMLGPFFGHFPLLGLYPT